MNVKANKLTNLISFTQYLPLLNKLPLCIVEDNQEHILNTIFEALSDIGVNVKNWLEGVVN